MTLEKNQIYKATVKKIMPFGAFVDIVNPENHRDRVSGMVHISEVDIKYVKNIEDFLKLDQEVEVVLLGINENGKYSFSIKKAMEKKLGENSKSKESSEKSETPVKRDFNKKKEQKKDQKEDNSFEAMMSRFKRISEDKMCDLNRGRDRRNNSRGGR